MFPSTTPFSLSSSPITSHTSSSSHSPSPPSHFLSFFHFVGFLFFFSFSLCLHTDNLKQTPILPVSLAHSPRQAAVADGGSHCGGALDAEGVCDIIRERAGLGSCRLGWGSLCQSKKKRTNQTVEGGLMSKRCGYDNVNKVSKRTSNKIEIRKKERLSWVLSLECCLARQADADGWRLLLPSPWQTKSQNTITHYRSFTSFPNFWNLLPCLALPWLAPTVRRLHQISKRDETQSWSPQYFTTGILKIILDKKKWINKNLWQHCVVTPTATGWRLELSRHSLFHFKCRRICRIQSE